MSSPKAAPRAAAPKALSLAAMLSPARAAASRTNGAKSKGPKTAEGKARSAQNALKHGLRAQKYVVLPDEDAAAFQALEAALMDELAPQGALQGVLAQRVVAAAWRLKRADQIEAEVFARRINDPFGKGDLGLALIRDCNGAKAFGALLRYRGGTLAEFWRALRTLKALQAEAAEPIKPERRGAPDDFAPAPAASKTAPEAVCPSAAKLPPRRPMQGVPVPGARPTEPETRRKPTEPAPRSMPAERAETSGSGLNGTAPVALGRRGA